MVGNLHALPFLHDRTTTHMYAYDRQALSERVRSAIMIKMEGLAAGINDILHP